jgi:hypothetical protein
MRGEMLREGYGASCESPVSFAWGKDSVREGPGMRLIPRMHKPPYRVHIDLPPEGG